MPFGGPDAEIARPFYVASLAKRGQQMGEILADPKAISSNHTRHAAMSRS